MGRTTLRRGLIALNGALALGLLAVALAAPADAQRAARARGEYTMVSSKIQGGNSHVVYLVDAANQELLGLRWNESNKGLEGVGYRDLAIDAQANPGR
jgi:hypothetical protein